MAQPAYKLTLAEEGYPQCLGCGAQLGEYWENLPGARDTGQPWCSAKTCYPRRKRRSRPKRGT